jgi:type II secretion system protein I
MKSSPCKHSSRNAFTLLEVVVGTTILASVLVSSMMAFGAHHRQARLAAAKLTAVSIADELLNQFSTSRTGIPSSDRGAIAGQRNWFWQTSLVGTTQPASVPLQVIRLEIIEVSNDGPARSLATVEVVKLVEGAFAEEPAQ